MFGPHFFLASAIVAFSAWVQASVGFGYALLAAPLLALVAPDLVPGPIMLSSFVLSSAAAIREHQSMDRRGIVWALVGRVPGVALAGLALASLPGAVLSFVFATLVLLAVAMSMSGWKPPLTAATLMATGFVSGTMGTLTSIGGPPIAMLYQHESGPRLRSTLNTYFALGSCMSIPMLAWVGRFGLAELKSGAWLLPACGLGFLLSNLTRRFVDAGRTRGAVLWVATLSALGVVIKALFT